MSPKVQDDYIDLEALLDNNKQIKKELFLSVMELSEFKPQKLKRLLTQCLRLIDEFGVYCAARVCCFCYILHHYFLSLLLHSS